MNIYSNSPYTYFLMWSNTKTKYYGCQYGKKSNPNNILSHSYKTSSRYVKDHWSKNGPPDIIIIHRIFETAAICRQFEHEYLKRVHAVLNPSWLNKTDNKSIAPECSGGAKAARASHISRMAHVEQDPEFKEKLRQHGINNFQSVSAMVKRKDTFKETNHSQGKNNPRYGIKVSGTETAAKISIARKLQVDQNRKAAEILNTKNRVCEYCGTGNLTAGNYKRWHHTNCKLCKQVLPVLTVADPECHI